MIPGEPLQQSNYQTLKNLIRKVFFKNKAVGMLLGATLGIHILLWVLFLVIHIKARGLPVILHYSIFRGVDLLGASKTFFLLPLGGSIIIAINFSVAKILYNTLRSASYLLLGTAFISQLIILLTLVTFFVIN